MNRRLPFLRPQRGMSLIELMVGLAAGLLLVAGLALLFANASRSSAELEKSLRQIENGRFALDLLAEDLSMAGYFGEAQAQGGAETVSPCASTAQVLADLDAKRAATPARLPEAVRGYTADEAAALGCLADHLPGTPALALRRLHTTAVPIGDMIPDDVYVQSSHHREETTATYLASTDPAALTLRDRNGATNVVRRYVSRVYYLARCSECGRDTLPTLKRAELREGAIHVAPLADGIERIAFDYGFDIDADGAPDTWLGLNAPGPAGTPGSGGAAGAPESAAAVALGWGNVVAVRIHLVARTAEPTAGFTDGGVYALGTRGLGSPVAYGPMRDAFKRRAYVTTVRLHSVAGARE